MIGTETSFPRETLLLAREMLATAEGAGASMEMITDALAASLAAILATSSIHTPKAHEAALAEFSQRVRAHVLDGLAMSGGAVQ